MNLLKPPIEMRAGFKDPKHLARVAQLECIVCKNQELKQLFRTEVHHLIGMGLGKKASDLFTIPLCSFHHRLGNKGEAIHSGKQSFEKKFGTQQNLLEQTKKDIVISDDEI